MFRGPKFLSDGCQANRRHLRRVVISVAVRADDIERLRYQSFRLIQIR